MATPGRPLKVDPELEMLFHDVRDQSLETISKILSKHSIDAHDPEGLSALNCAAFHQRMDVIEFLIEQKADLNFQDRNGWTSLHWAVNAQSPEVVAALIAAGAEVDRPNEKGSTPLLKAVVDFENNDGELNIIQQLLAAGADIQHQNNFGNSPFTAIVDFHENLAFNPELKDSDLFFLISDKD